MFTKTQEEYLIRRLNRNEVVLFLGAGFSFNATNHLEVNLPVGNQLTINIWEFMYPGVPFPNDGTSLQDIYQALLKSGKSFDEIKHFLIQNLTVKSYADFYKYINLPFWYKIYTINIDNLLDKIYDPWGGQQLDTISFPKGEFKERDQLLDKIQAIYLHGKLPCKPDEVIFSRGQYASSAVKLQPLYFHFINDYANLPTIFIGTSLEEQLFDQYIATRQSINTTTPENRPKSFLITPSISPIRESNLKNDYNIEVIKSTTQDFLLWLEINSGKLLTKEEILRSVNPTYDKLLTHSKFKPTHTHSIQEFTQSFSRVDITRQFPPKKKNYLLGSSPTWADIHYAMDAPRKITGQISKRVDELFSGDSTFRCLAILGNAGSGKSTVLKRLAHYLASAGRTVYYSYSESLPSIGDIVEALQMLNERVVISLDNAELLVKQLVTMAEALNKLKYPPIFIIASRTNIFDRVSSKYDPIINLEEFQMPNLDRNEIIEVLKKLSENNLLGHLKGMTEANRIQEFEYKARKQILVAMREATEGKDFDEIMKSEFHEIPTEEAKILCLCVCLTTEAGFTISRQDFTSFSSKPPAEALDILERNLKGIVMKVGPKEDRLLLRHRTIADYFMQICATPELLKKAYIRVLSSLASEINSSTTRSRKFSLYIEIINHYKIYQRFSKNIDQAREVYEALVDYFQKDFHVWLQYGSLELEGAGGNIEFAENYLNQAFSLMNKSTFVKNALAQLYYKKSLYASSKAEANSLKDAADQILITLIKDKYNNDPYTYHIYGKGYYNWILHWLTGPEPIRKALQPLEKIIKAGCNLYPNNIKLKELKEVISKAILITAVADKNVAYPLLYSEF